MPNLTETTADGQEVTFTVDYAPAPGTRRCTCHPDVPSAQEDKLRALHDDLVRAADSAHWARFDGFEGVLRALADAVGERRG